MRSNLIHEEYSSDKQYKFQVYQEDNWRYRTRYDTDRALHKCVKKECV